MQQVEEALSLPLNQNEFSYIALHMGAKLSSTPGKKSGVNIVISRKIDELTGRMLEILLKVSTSISWITLSCACR
ncbi:hypothetical protein WDV93_17995 [Pantoea ananatis]